MKSCFSLHISTVPFWVGQGWLIMGNPDFCCWTRRCYPICYNWGIPIIVGCYPSCFSLCQPLYSWYILVIVNCRPMTNYCNIYHGCTCETMTHHCPPYNYRWSWYAFFYQQLLATFVKLLLTIVEPLLPLINHHKSPSWLNMFPCNWIICPWFMVHNHHWSSWNLKHNHESSLG